jgi:hypothetical protein
MLNLSSSAESYDHPVQQFRFYGQLTDSNHRTVLQNMSDQCSISQLQPLSRTGSRVKTVGSWRRTTAHSVHDVSKVKRELTKRNSLVEGSSKTSIRLDSLPSSRIGSRVKTVGSWRRTTSHSVHDVSKVKRELTKRNSLVEGSSKTSVHLDSLPSSRIGSRVKTVGSWRRTTMHSVHDISKVKRELTKRNSLVEGSSKTSVHLDSLPSSRIGSRVKTVGSWRRTTISQCS